MITDRIVPEWPIVIDGVCRKAGMLTFASLGVGPGPDHLP